MERIKKVLSYSILLLVAVTGLLFGCKGKYDDMKLVSSADGQKEVVLYVPEEGQEGVPEDSYIVITYKVQGVGKDVSKDVIFPSSDEYIEISDIQKNKGVYSVKITAKKGMLASHDFVVTTKEGGVQNKIKIRCEKRITEMTYTGVQYAIINKVNQTLQLNSAELLSFNPQDATQKDVVYSTTAAGVTLTQEGLLTINEQLTATEIPVTITSKYNSSFVVNTNVKVVTELTKDKVLISTVKDSTIAEDGVIGIMSNVPENSMQYLKVEIDDVNFNYVVNFSVDGNVARISEPNVVNAYADGSKSNAEASLMAYSTASNGNCKLYVSISLADYKGVAPLVITRDVSVSKIAKRIQVTADKKLYTSNFALDVSTSYGNAQNGLPLLVELVDQNLNDVHFFVTKKGDIEIYNQAGIQINALDFQDNHTYQGIDLTNDFVFENGDKIYIRGTGVEEAKVVIYALGSNDGDRYLTYLTIDCDTYISAENIEVVPTKVKDAEGLENTIYVEVGKSVSLAVLQENENDKAGYKKDNGSAKNVKLAFQSNSTNIAKNVDVSYQNSESDTPTITITGKTANAKNTYIYAYLELPNFITSEVFKIFVFESIKNVVVTVDDKQSILKNIEYGDHSYAGVSPSLSYIAIKNVGTIAYVDFDVATASLDRKVEAYNISYAPNQSDGVIYFDSQNKSRLYLNGNGEIDYSSIYNLEIIVETLVTESDGSIKLTKIVIDDIRLQIIKELKESDISIFYILNNLDVSKSNQAIYWKDKLPDACDVVQKNLVVGLDIKSDFLDYASWVNECEYTTGGLVDNQDKTRYSIAAIYEDYRLGGGAAYEEIPSVINGRIGVQVNYFGQIIIKYLNYEVKKPVLPAYMRIEQPTSESVYSIATNGARGYIINVNDLDKNSIKVYAKLYANDASDTVTDKKIVWKIKDTTTVLDSRVDDNGYSYCNVDVSSGKVVLSLAAEHNDDLIKEVVIYKLSGQNEASAVEIKTAEDFLTAINDQTGSYFKLAFEDDKLDIDMQGKEIPSSFAGHINGQNKTVVLKNISSYLIEKIENSASISNVKFEIENVDVSPDDTVYYAALAKENYGTLSGVEIKYVSDNDKNEVKVASVHGIVYFGGLVNLNFAVIEHCSVLGSVLIDGQSYVGGLVTENGENGQINDVKFVGSIVVYSAETSDDFMLGGITAINSGNISLAGVIADKIEGIKNVGGVVGQMTAGKLSGAYVRTAEDVEIEKYYKTSDYQYVDGKTYYELSGENYIAVQTVDTEHPENLTNYYEKVVYFGRTQLKAKTYVAGLVALIQDAEIEKCFAEVDIIATDGESVAAGLVATMTNAKYRYGYVFATIQARTMAMVSASATNYSQIYQIYAVVNEQTVNSLPFVAGDNSSVAVLYCAKQTVKGQSASGYAFDDLTYKFIYMEDPLYWDIGENSKYWQIDNTRNNGYPVLVYNGSVLDDTIVKRFKVELRDDYKVVDGIIRLELDKEYRITDLLKFTINDLELNNTSNYRVYVSSNVNIGELSSVKKSLSDNLKISSIYAKIVVLTFECGGYSIDKTFAFAREIVGLNGEVTVTGNVKKNVTFNYQADNARIISANAFDSDMYIAIKNLPECITIDNETVQTINEVEYHLIQSSLTLKSSESVNIAFDLYQLVDNQFIKINDAEATLKVIYIGEKATKILADSEYLLITPSSDQTIVVYVYKNHDGDNTIANAPEVKKELDAAFAEYLFVSDEPIIELFDGGYKYTFKIGFNDEYLDKLAHTIYTTLENISYDRETPKVIEFSLQDQGQKYLTVNVRIDVSLQSVSNVDANTYPVEKKNNNTFVSDNVNANLTAGEMALLDLNIYPQVGTYNRIEVTSSKTADDVKFGFIQLVKYNNARYLEAKPNAILIENGVKLYRISQLDINDVVSFDGHFYVACILNGVLATDTTFEITVKIYLSADDNSPITKVISLKVLATPDVALEFANEQPTGQDESDSLNFAPLGESNGVARYYMLARGKQVNLTQILGFTPINIEYTLVVGYHKNSSSKDFEAATEEDLKQLFTIANYDSNWTLTASENARQGLVVAVRITAYKSVVGSLLTSSYESNWMYFYVVDYIIKDVKIIQPTNTIYLNQTSIVGAEVQAIYDENIPDVVAKIANLNATLNNGVLYKKTEDTEIANNKTYYKLNGLVFEEIAEENLNVADIANYFEVDAAETRYINNYWYEYDQSTTRNDQMVSYSYTLLFGPKYIENDSEQPVIYGIAGEGIYIYGTRVGNNATNVLNLILNYRYKETGDLVFYSKENSEGNGKNKSASTKFIVEESTTITSPLPINSISDFYSMSANVDYILMTDLTFGASSVEDGEENFKTTDAYVQFSFVANSLDGNTHSITILGDNALGFGLFDSVSSNSIIKNLDVIYAANSGADNVYEIQMANNGATLSLGGFAGQNLGVITNCNVIYKANVIIKAKPSSSVAISGGVAGFVSENSGKITYSTVETGYKYTENAGVKTYFKDNNGDLIYKDQKITYTTNELYSYIDSDKIEQQSNVAVSLNMAGFVNSNSSLVSNCQVKGLGLDNPTSEKNKKLTAGFANSNTKNIFASSAEGVYTEGNTDSGDDSLYTSNQGNAILKSKYQIAGFVSTNSGTIRDSYANIPMDTTQGTSGFVFDNKSRGDGTITTCYTASQYIGTSTTNTHSAFIGTDEFSNILNDYEKGLVKHCYYVAKVQNNNSDGSQYDPAAYIDSAKYLSTIDAMEGFDIDSSTKKTEVIASDLETPKTIWKENSGKLLTLAENEYNEKIHDKYEMKITQIMPKGEDQKNYDYGEVNLAYTQGINIPKLVASAEELLDGYKLVSSDPEKYEYIYTNIRIVNDIDFSSVSSSDILEKLSNSTFAGYFDGNNMTMSGLNVIASSESTSTQPFGLFGQIGNNEDQTIVKNFTLKIKAVNSSKSVAVGAFAGLAVNVNVKNIAVLNQGGDAKVSGRNLVGGLFGLVIGNSNLYNLSSDVNVLSLYNNKEIVENNSYPDVYYKGYDDIGGTYYIDGDVTEGGSLKEYEFDEFINTLKGKIANCSYAGGIAGVVDINVVNYERSDSDGTSDDLAKIHEVATSNFSIATVSGDITISGGNAGGILGYMGKNTYLTNAEFVVSVSDSQRISAYRSAGGLIGENVGGIVKQSTVSLDSENAYNYDKNLTNTVGNNLFADCDNPDYIGGLIGYSNGGAVIHSYSKTNVINLNAKYAGGLIGGANANQFINQVKILKGDSSGEYLSNDITNNSRITRGIYLEEVYVTGNVFAGAHYNDSDEDNGTIISTPLNYAGGIFGYLKIDESSYGNQFMVSGVIGINGFHRPDSYELPTAKDVNGNMVTATYGQIATGYDFQTKNAAGVTKIKKYGATVGAFVGKLDADNLSYNNAAKPTLLTQYAYNGTEIRLSDAVNKNGENMALAAKGGEINNLSNKTWSNAQSFSFESGIFKVYLNYLEADHPSFNSDEGAVKSYKFGNEYSYFVLRGDNDKSVVIDNEVNQITETKYFSSFGQNASGVYSNWSQWLWKQPIYPSFLKSDLVYIPIETEDDLINMKPGKRYELQNDIYLTKAWTPKILYNTSLISKKRDKQDTGINGDPYYTIYNINIYNNNKNVGFFSNADMCRISNVNFVFGTSYNNQKGEEYSAYIRDGKVYTRILKENGEIKHYEEVGSGNIVAGNATGMTKYIGVEAGNVTNFGLLIAEGSGATISDCHVYIWNEEISEIKIQATSESDTNSVNIGGLIGSSSASEILNTNLQFVDVKTQEPYNNTIKWTEATTKSGPDEFIKGKLNIKVDNSHVNSLNVGGIVGSFNTLSKLSFASGTGEGDGGNYNLNIYADIKAESANANIGMIIGSAISGTIGIIGSDINLSDKILMLNTCYVKDANFGGFVGSVENVSNIDNFIINNFTIEFGTITIDGTTNEAANISGKFNLGGFAGKITANADFKGRISISNITIRNLTYNIKNSENAGGFVGLLNIQSGGVSITGCEVDTIKSKKTNSETGEKLGVSGKYIGGFIGQIETNRAKSLSIDLNYNSVKNAVLNSAVDGVACGGFIGMSDAKDANLICCEVNGLTIRDSSKSGGGKFEYIGGFAGLLDANKIIGCSVEMGTADANQLYAGDDTQYIGGFVGKSYGDGTNNNGSIEQTVDCYVNGIISCQEVNNIKCLGGFAGEYRSKNINYCLSDVKIYFIITNDIDQTYVAGFIGKTTVETKITNSIAMGVIEQQTSARYYTNIKIYGFVAETDGTTYNANSNNYALVTIMLLGENVGATTPSENNDEVYYVYNVSGVFNKDNNGTRLSYSDLADVYRENSKIKLIKESALVDVAKLKVENKNQFVTYLNSLLEGAPGKSILNPYLFDGSITDPGFYLIDSDIGSSKSLNSDTINKGCYLIAKNDQLAPTIECSRSIITNYGYIAGVELRASDATDAIIGTNEGYIFNCIGTGKVVATSDDTAGFVQTNNRYINACGSMANIYAEEHIASGFVNYNAAYIYNCWATNTIYNVKNYTDESKISYYGFVRYSKNENNCYAAVALDCGDINAEKLQYNYSLFGFTFNLNHNIAQNYFDNEFNSVTGYTSKKYSELRTLGNNILPGFKKAENNSYQTNYGYPVSVSFTNVSDFNNSSTEDMAYFGTGTNSEDYPYIIHSIDQLDSIVASLGTSGKLHAKMISNINAIKGAKISVGYNFKMNLIDIKNNENYLHGIYNILIAANGTTVGLFNSGRNVNNSLEPGVINLENLAIYGKISNYRKNIVGLVVGETNQLTATNVKAVLSHDGGDLPVSLEQYSFGIFAGHIGGTSTLNNCSVGLDSASGMHIESNNGNVGGFIGEAHGTLKIGGDELEVSLGKSSLVGENAGGVVGYLGNSASVKGKMTIDTSSIKMQFDDSGTLSGNCVGGIVGAMEENSDGLVFTEKVAESDEGININVNLSGTGNDNCVGGITGKLVSKLDLSNVTINVSGNMTGINVGGIAGIAAGGDIKDVTVNASLSISGETTNAGGLFGKFGNEHEEGEEAVSATITHCAYSGAISLKDSAKVDYLGGIVGYMTNGSISNITIEKGIWLNAKNVGGIVGYMKNSEISAITISNAVFLFGENAGGIVGKADNSNIIAKSINGAFKGNIISGKIYIAFAESWRINRSGTSSLIEISPYSELANDYGIIIQNVSQVKYITDANWGGIVGIIDNGRIEDSTITNGIELHYRYILDADYNISAQQHNLGGIVGTATNSSIGSNNSISIVGSLDFEGEFDFNNIWSFSSSRVKGLNIGGVVGYLNQSTLTNYCVDTSMTAEVCGGVEGYEATDNIGGVVGCAIANNSEEGAPIEKGVQIENISIGNKLTVTGDGGYCYANVGGLIGKFEDKRSSYDANDACQLTGNNSAVSIEYSCPSDNPSTSYVGGLIGYCDVSGLVCGTSAGDISGKTSATKQAKNETTPIYDAKEYNDGGWEGWNVIIMPAGVFLVPWPYKTDFHSTGYYCYGGYLSGHQAYKRTDEGYKEVFEKNKMSIPLAVGGIFGYLKNAELNDSGNSSDVTVTTVDKISGNVSAYISGQKDAPKLPTTKSVDNSNEFIKNHETYQCHSGALAGLSFENKYVNANLTSKCYKFYYDRGWGGYYTSVNTVQGNNFVWWGDVDWDVREIGMYINNYYVPCYDSSYIDPVKVGTGRFSNYSLYYGKSKNTKINWFDVSTGSATDIWNKFGPSISDYDSQSDPAYLIKNGKVIATKDNQGWTISGNVNMLDGSEKYVRAGILNNGEFYNKSYWSVLDNQSSELKAYAIQDWAGEYVGGVVHDETSEYTITVNYYTNKSGSENCKYTETKFASKKQEGTGIIIKDNIEIKRSIVGEFNGSILAWTDEQNIVDYYTLSANGSGEKFYIGNEIMKSHFANLDNPIINLYAHWTKNNKYHVQIYNLDSDKNFIQKRDGEGNLVYQVNPETGEYMLDENGEKIPEYDIANETIDISSSREEIFKLEKKGYKFIQINISGSSGGSIGNMTMDETTYINTNKVYAYWVSNYSNGKTVYTSYLSDNYENLLPEQENNGKRSNQFFVGRMPVTYYVKFNANGGTGSIDRQSFIYDATPNALSSIQNGSEYLIERKGYTFLGWSTTPDGDVEYDDSYLFGQASDLDKLVGYEGEEFNLYAKWAPVTYTITYNTNGATLPDDSNTSYTIEDHLVELPTNVMAPDGFQFLGWYDNNTYQGEPITSFEPNENNIGERTFWAKVTGVKIGLTLHFDMPITIDMDNDGEMDYKDEENITIYFIYHSNDGKFYTSNDNNSTSDVFDLATFYNKVAEYYSEYDSSYHFHGFYTQSGSQSEAAVVMITTEEPDITESYTLYNGLYIKNSLFTNYTAPVTLDASVNTQA